MLMAPTPLLESSFEMASDTPPWAVGTPPPLSTANCTGCVSYTDVRKVEVTQPYETFKDFRYYPFDDHVVQITLTLRGGVVANCPSVPTTTLSTLSHEIPRTLMISHDLTRSPSILHDRRCSRRSSNPPPAPRPRTRG